MGVLVSRRRRGACVALEWSEAEQRYHCGLLTGAAKAGRGAQRLMARWIGAGVGCDAELLSMPDATLQPGTQRPGEPHTAPSR